MHIIADNTNDMADRVYPILFSHGVEQSSRNGQIITLEEPIILSYDYPIQRVNFSEIRDANPFFHLLEAIWMMAGRDDVKWIADILPKMEEFSDNGETFYGAYGPRLYDLDQLIKCAALINSDRDTRRAVAAIWRPHDVESAKWTKDLPCNLLLMFRVRMNSLEMTVVNRSNDAVWGGVTGSNIVHFSLFHEYVAKMANLRIGRMNVFSNNLHMYLNEQTQKLYDYYSNPSWNPPEFNRYHQGAKVTPISGTKTMEMFPLQCQEWVKNCGVENYESVSPFLNEVATPMYVAYKYWRNGAKKNDDGLKSLAYDHLLSMPDKCDWKIAAQTWMERRIGK